MRIQYLLIPAILAMLVGPMQLSPISSVVAKGIRAEKKNDVLFRRAILKKRQGQYDEAKQILLDLYEKDQENRVAYMLGRLYMDPYWDKANPYNAIVYFRKVVTMGGLLYATAAKGQLMGLYTQVQRYHKVLPIMDEFVALDNVPALFLYSWYYGNGLGVKMDLKKAVQYAEKALALNSQELGPFQLGFLHYIASYYYQSLDDRKALSHAQKSVRLGFRSAHYVLGNLKLGTANIAKDDRAALKHYLEVTKRPKEPYYADSLYAVAYLYVYGDAKIVDVKKAVSYAQKAYDAGAMQASILLGMFYEQGIGVTVDGAKAQAYYNDCLRYYPNEQVCHMQLGKMFLTGQGVSRNEQEFLKHMNILVQQNNPQAMLELARFYQNKEKHKSDFYFSMACENGLEEACR